MTKGELISKYRGTVSEIAKTKGLTLKIIETDTKLTFTLNGEGAANSLGALCKTAYSDRAKTELLTNITHSSRRATADKLSIRWKDDA